MADTFKPLNLKRNDIYLAALPKCTQRDTGPRASLPLPMQMPAVEKTASGGADIYSAAIEALT
jgi:hypothetical protein